MSINHKLEVFLKNVENSLANVYDKSAQLSGMPKTTESEKSAYDAAHHEFERAIVDAKQNIANNSVSTVNEIAALNTEALATAVQEATAQAKAEFAEKANNAINDNIAK